MPTSSIRWLHLSDFHVGKDDYESRKIFSYILNHVREKCENGFVPDMIFITGDLANSGMVNEYNEFLCKFFEPLIKILDNFSWSGKIFAVPGNHDLQRIYVEEIPRESRLGTGSIFFRTDSEGKKRRAIHEIRAFEQFGDFTIISELYPDNWLDLKEASFADICEIKNVHVGIAGINTAWLSRDHKDKEKLSPGIDILESAIDRIKNCDLRILLGHHPLDWFYPGHRQFIQNLLGDFNVIYLHGHLHETRTQPMETGGGKFIQIQSGAAFQVFEQDETKWQNGLLWAEVSSDLSQILLQPRYWKSNDRRWGISDDLHENKRVEGDWWAYPLPYASEYGNETIIQERCEKESHLTLPEGWKLVDDKFFEARSQALNDESFLQFFDGAIPLWNKEFLYTLPQRSAVNEIIKALKKSHNASRPSIFFISGAGGEGKSTVLLQSSLKLYETGEWCLLYHFSEKGFLTIESISKLPSEKPCLLVSDDAHLLVKDLIKLLPWLAQNRNDIHFLLASRVSDWYSTGGTRFGWSQHCLFREISLGKLDLNEAKAIVAIWSKYGKKGLNALYGLSTDEAAQKLYEACEDEEGRGQGAFIGAMIKVRMADGLKDHIKLFLSRLNERKIKNTADLTLLDAFAAISFMHCEGLTFLSMPVLAQYIYGNPVKSIRGSIITPLGREAAIAKAGEFIFTRHTIIAQVASELLEKDFGMDPDEIFCQLGEAAIEARENGTYIPEIGKWRYEFPNHFLESNRQRIAIAIGKAQLNLASDNLLLLTNLAKLYRRAELPDQAVQLFHDFKGKKKDRTLYYEWAVSESKLGNQFASVIIAATSIADWQFPVAPNNTDGIIILTGIGKSFKRLFNDHHNTVFRDALGACGILGLKLRQAPAEKNNFSNYYEEAKSQGTPEMDMEEAFNALEHGILVAMEYSELNSELTGRIPTQAEITFDGLKRLIRRATARKRS